MPNDGTDGEDALTLVEGVELGHAVDVDEHGWLSEPQGHERNEALAAGEDLGVIACLGEGIERFLERGRGEVVERRWLQGR